MISTTMATALNEQIKWEMYSANLYLAMSAYLQDAGLTGFSHWMRIQYQEETAHALKFYDFLLSRGGQVTMLSIDAPDANWSNILEIFEETLSSPNQRAGASCQGRTGFRHGYFPAMVCHRTGGRGRNRQGHHQQITHD